MDSQPNPEYNPLTVPVRQATPQELEIQARHHATNAAYATFDELLESTFRMEWLLDCFGEPFVTTLHLMDGSTMLDTARIVQLATLLDDTTVVFYRAFKAENTVMNGYGILSKDSRNLYARPVAMIALQTSEDVIRTTARTLNDMHPRAALYAAYRRTGGTTLTSEDIDLLKER